MGLKDGRAGRFLLVIAFTLSGCQFSDQRISGPGLSRAESAIASYAAPTRVGSDAKSKKLLYVSTGGSEVFVYSYPKGRLLATLTGFGLANGMCTDTQGNIFITDGLLHEIVEYAHGGSAPIATLAEDSGFLPYGCSVDPLTNNLAVTNESPGNVAVFEDAQGIPTIYSFSGAAYWACAYDDNSNLFVTGFGNSFLLELQSGATKLSKITVNKKFNGASIQWDGQYLAVNNLPRSKRSTNLYRLSVSGSSATVVSTVMLDTFGVSRLPGNGQYWVQGKNVLGAAGINRGGVGLGFWDYPRGGKTTKLIKAQHAPVGVVVSVSP
jgi:DNA-binding beta-propeller fold protein YncE